LDNYFNIKFRLWEEFKLSIDFIEKIPFYEYQIFIDNLNKKIEENNKKIEKEGMIEAFSFTKPKFY